MIASMDLSATHPS